MHTYTHICTYIHTHIHTYIEAFYLLYIHTFARAEDQCKTKPHTITLQEKELLKANIHKVTTEMNKDELKRVVSYHQ